MIETNLGIGTEEDPEKTVCYTMRQIQESLTKLELKSKFL